MLNPNLEKQIAAAARAVEEARRVAHRDVARLGDLVENINVLAELRLQEGDFRKAESLYREALFRIQDTRQPDAGLTVGVYSLLAYLYDRWGKHKEAAEFYQKALKLGRERGIHDADKVATVKNNLAMLHKGMREFDKAQAYYEEALADFRGAHGGNSPKVASVPLRRLRATHAIANPTATSTKGRASVSHSLNRAVQSPSWSLHCCASTRATCVSNPNKRKRVTT